MKRRPGLVLLEETIVGCTRCPRLVAYRRRVAREKRRAYRDQTYWGRPVPGFGDSRARLLVIGLAPAAHGGNRTGRVFTGDSSGDWLYEALHRYGFADRPVSVARGDGLRLTDCWVSAAARCAPPDNKPTHAELSSCRPYLEAEIRLLPRVRIIVALGRIAHGSWLRAAGWWERLPVAGRPPFAHAAEAVLPDGAVLIASYHPSRQNTNTGRLTRPMWHAIFARVREILDHEPRSGRTRATMGDGRPPVRTGRRGSGPPAPHGSERRDPR
ncbi:MAG TPA: uracil-DNA glycosylase [Candidatus Polarisedimenticolia bacterium]|nr:uracil-DNA glycosylase [Candidatus Polarisedimenticolia bacterium]